MSAERVAQLAAYLEDATGIGCAPVPAPPGRGDVFAFCEPPTYVFEPAALTFCPGGRTPMLRTSVVVVGAGTDTGQLEALIDAAEAVVLVLEAAPGWIPAGDATPAQYGDTPAYSIPVRTT
jgi:hypothetical protein